MVSPYLMRPVRRLEDVLQIRKRMPAAPEARPGPGHPHRAGGGDFGLGAKRPARPRVVWVNERLPKRWRKPHDTDSNQGN